MFMAFIYGFFTFEHQHEREEHELMSELEVLRKQNMEVSKKLVEAEKRFIRRFDDDAVEEAGDEPEGNNAMEYDESDDEEAAAAELSEASARAASLAARMPQGANGGLGGACARKKVDWWTFEVCVGERVTQFHDADDHGAFEEHFMGGWVGAAVDVSRGGRVDGAALWRLQYKHGERCDGGEERTVEVELRCAERPASPGFVITDVHEPSICHYRIGAVAPASRCVGLDALRPSAAVAEAVARGGDRRPRRRRRRPERRRARARGVGGAAADGGGGGARGDAAPRRGRRREFGGEPRDHPDLRRHGGGRQARRCRERAPPRMEGLRGARVGCGRAQAGEPRAHRLGGARPHDHRLARLVVSRGAQRRARARALLGAQESQVPHTSRRILSSRPPFPCVRTSLARLTPHTPHTASSHREWPFPCM